MTRKILDFEDRIERITESGCWIWTGMTNDAGYAMMRINGKHKRVHRLIYEKYKGPLKEGFTIDHLCRVRCCVNPNHLEQVTKKVNTLRGVGWAARNAKKTHCPKGHEYTKDNILPIRRAKDGRRCRKCMRELTWKYNRRRYKTHYKDSYEPSND